MRITMVQLFRGCLIASIAHAIMTNVYPELAYEQSWDGTNYSIQNAAGLRGTITFENEYCIGAIRNDNSAFAGNEKHIDNITRCFPPEIVKKAYSETLQYLLVERNGVPVPSATSMFWANSTMFYFHEENVCNMKEDLKLLDKILLPERLSLSAWKEYYAMSPLSVRLLKQLYRIKAKSLFTELTLDREQLWLLPGNNINSECIESLRELKIYVP